MAATEEMLQEARDKKNQAKIDAAYSKSLTTTEEAPEPPKSAGAGRGFVNPPMKPEAKPEAKPEVKKMAEGGSVDKAQDKAMIVKAFKQHDAQEHKGGKGTILKLASGGSASRRADGIAQRGKTRGKVC